LRADVARADTIPNDDQHDGSGEDESRDGVDFGRDAAAEASPDFEGECVVAADEEEGDGDFVHGERKDEQAGGDERQPKIGERDAPESLPRCGAEIERSFFLSALHFLQAGEELRGGYGDESGAMAEENGEETELRSSEDGEHEQ